MKRSKLREGRAIREANRALSPKPKGWARIPAALARGLWDVLIEWIGGSK